MEKEHQTEEITSTFKLRQGTPEDCELMFRLQKLDGAELNQSDLDQISNFEEYKKEFKPTEIQVVYFNDQPVGRLRIVREDDIYIGGMQILPEYRGGGLGTMILASLIEESKETLKSIRLEVFHNNFQALSLYEKTGFRVVDETEYKKIMLYEPS